jgi:hypothetical protein
MMPVLLCYLRFAEIFSFSVLVNHSLHPYQSGPCLSSFFLRVTFLTFLGTVAYSLLITDNQEIVRCTSLVVKHSPTSVTRNPIVRYLFRTLCTMKASVMKHENNVSRVVGYEPIISNVFMSLT